MRRPIQSIGLAIGLVIACAHGSFGQERESRPESRPETSPYFVRGGLTPAYALPISPFVSGKNTAGKPIRWLPYSTVEFGRQTDGTREWHHLYGFPSYGVGLSLASAHAKELGAPVGVYTFFSWPFARPSERVHVTTDFGMGASWAWTEFHPSRNRFNDVIGSDLNFRINWGFYLRYLMTPRTSLYAGIDFSHRSNGGTRQPNEGVNTIGPKVALRYDAGVHPRRPPVTPPQPFQPAWEFVIGGGGGVKNILTRTDPLIRRYFGAFNVTTALQRHFYRYGKVAAGTDVTYDGATGARIDIIDGAIVERRLNARQRLAIGLYGGYEHVISRFSVIVQAGYIVARSAENPRSTRFYQRFGWRYRINDRLWGKLAIQSIRFSRADFLELGLGYRVRW